MLGLPDATRLNRPLPKSAIYAKFQMSAAAKERMDRDISRLYIVHEVSAANVHLKEGAQVKCFFVVSVQLRRRDYDEKNILLLSKLIPQRMVMALHCAGEARLAVFCRRLLQTAWMPRDALSLSLAGLDLDAVWENIVAQIAGLTVPPGQTLDEALRLREKREKLQREIDRLEKQAWAEKQPKKKFELAQRLARLRQEMEACRP